MAYDIFDTLVKYWQIQITKPQDLYDLLKQLKPNHENYAHIKQEIKDHWLGKKKLEPITLAAYYYFNHNLSYGPGFLGWLSSVYAKQDVYDRMIQKVRDFKVDKL
jgi:DNA adenine methylase